MPWALKTTERLYARNVKAKAHVSPWALKDLSSHQAEDSPGAAGGFLSASPGVWRALLKYRLEAWTSWPRPSYLSFQGVFCVLHQDHLARPPPYFVQLPESESLGLHFHILCLPVGAVGCFCCPWCVP